MNKYKIEVLKKKFPFLNKVLVDDGGGCTLGVDDVDKISVKKDEKLLERKGIEDSYSWAGGGHYDYTKYFAIYHDAEGEHIFELESESYSGTGSGESHEKHAPTIGEQLFAEGIKPDYIVECVRDDVDNDGNGSLTHSCVLYMMKEFDFDRYYKDKLEKAAEALGL